MKPGKVQSIPNTTSGLCEFISEKSTPYETILVHHTVDVLDTEDLKGTLQSYESNLGNHLRQTLESYKKRKVTLPLRKDHTHLAIVLSKEQILLSLVLHIKEYLMKYLQLEETIFEGFGEGCTVLFYSILKFDAVLLTPKILSHLTELKRMFDITHLIVFDYFACDLDRAIVELPVSVCVGGGVGVYTAFHQTLILCAVVVTDLHLAPRIELPHVLHIQVLLYNIH